MHFGVVAGEMTNRRPITLLSTAHVIASEKLVASRGPDFPLPVIVNSVLADNTLANCRVSDSGGATFPLTNNSLRNLDTDNSCGFSTVGPNGSIVLVPANHAPLAANFGSQDASLAGRKSGARLGQRLRVSAEGSALPQPSDRRRLSTAQ